MNTDRMGQWCHAHERALRDRSEVAWPGDGKAEMVWLRARCREWHAVLGGLTYTGLNIIALSRGLAKEVESRVHIESGPVAAAR